MSGVGRSLLPLLRKEGMCAQWRREESCQSCSSLFAVVTFCLAWFELLVSSPCAGTFNTGSKAKLTNSSLVYMANMRVKAQLCVYIIVRRLQCEK